MNTSQWILIIFQQGNRFDIYDLTTHGNFQKRRRLYRLRLIKLLQGAPFSALEVCFILGALVRHHTCYLLGYSLLSTCVVTSCGWSNDPFMGVAYQICCTSAIYIRSHDSRKTAVTK